MTRYLMSCLAGFLLVASPVFAQGKKAQNVPEIPYDSVPNFLKMPPGLYMGEAMGVATNSKGHVFVFTRSANTRLFEFDKTGNYVGEIGEGNYGFEFAHSVRVDSEDNVWVVDEGTNMVIKFNPAGRIVMVLGHRPPAIAGMLAAPQGPPGPTQKYILGRPTDVGWDKDGNIFVSDGYVNNRVVKYDNPGPPPGARAATPRHGGEDAEQRHNQGPGHEAHHAGFCMKCAGRGSRRPGPFADLLGQGLALVVLARLAGAVAVPLPLEQHHQADERGVQVGRHCSAR